MDNKVEDIAELKGTPFKDLIKQGYVPLVHFIKPSVDEDSLNDIKQTWLKSSELLSKEGKGNGVTTDYCNSSRSAKGSKYIYFRYAKDVHEAIENETELSRFSEGNVAIIFVNPDRTYVANQELRVQSSLSPLRAQIEYDLSKISLSQHIERLKTMKGMPGCYLVDPYTKQPIQASPDDKRHNDTLWHNLQEAVYPDLVPPNKFKVFKNYGEKIINTFSKKVQHPARKSKGFKF